MCRLMEHFLIIHGRWIIGEFLASATVAANNGQTPPSVVTGFEEGIGTARQPGESVLQCVQRLEEQALGKKGAAVAQALLPISGGLSLLSSLKLSVDLPITFAYSEKNVVVGSLPEILALEAVHQGTLPASAISKVQAASSGVSKAAVPVFLGTAAVDAGLLALCN